MALVYLGLGSNLGDRAASIQAALAELPLYGLEVLRTARLYETEPWGVQVSVVEIKDVELPPQMQRAMARQAEAEREKRAKIIHAEGEMQAAQQLQRAAATMATEPLTMQLRYLQTLTEISVEKNSTIIFPVPIDLVSGLLDMMNQSNHNQPDRLPR